MGTRCADHVTPIYPQKLALTSPTGGGRSVGIVRVRTKATEFSLVFNLYFSDAFENRMSVTILRLPGGQDYSNLAEEVDTHAYYNDAFSLEDSNQDLTKKNQTGFLRVDSNDGMAQMYTHPSNNSLSVVGKQ